MNDEALAKLLVGYFSRFCLMEGSRFGQSLYNQITAIESKSRFFGGPRGAKDWSTNGYDWDSFTAAIASCPGQTSSWGIASLCYTRGDKVWRIKVKEERDLNGSVN